MIDRRKAVAVLGSTGSIGRQTLDVIARHPERFSVVALAAHSSIDLLCEQVDRYRPQLVAVWDEGKAALLRERLAGKVRVLDGMNGLKEAATHPEADIVMNALVGMVGLEPTLAALRANKVVALANKETLVAGGDLVTRTARESGGRIIPVDSEHSAIFQCLQGSRQGLASITLTASGGPFWRLTTDQMRHVTREQALNHPRWRMGPKVSIDSATMMNKGLEVIEARWLFDLEPYQIKVVIHPQSTIHSLVEYIDGSMLAQLGPQDMRLPIQYALSYPERLPLSAGALSLTEVANLEFAAPDFNRFPALPLAYHALKAGGTAATVLNAANEVAVAAFLNEEISFATIIEVAESVVERHAVSPVRDLEDVLCADQWGRRTAEDMIRHLR